MPKISIIVPIYNVEKTLKKCLDSLVNQTLKDIEIILVDDGSIDNSSNICDEYAKNDNRIIVIHQKNSGVGKANNEGIKRAGGEYIGFLEPDDYTELNMYEELYSVAKKDSSDIVKSDFYSWVSKKDLSIPKKIISESMLSNVYKNPEILGIQPSIWSAIYKKELILKNNIQFLETEGASYQDTSFAFKVNLCADKISLLNIPFVHYCIDNSFSSVKSNKKVYAICKEYDEIERFLKEKNILDKKIIERKYINQWHAYIWNLKRISPIFKNEFIERIISDFYNYYSEKKFSKEAISLMKIESIENIFISKKSLKKFLVKTVIRNNLHDYRKKMFSLHLSKKEIYLKLFGIELVKNIREI